VAQAKPARSDEARTGWSPGRRPSNEKPPVNEEQRDKDLEALAVAVEQTRAMVDEFIQQLLATEEERGSSRLDVVEPPERRRDAVTRLSPPRDEAS
jgi:hypothetical protein